MHRDFTWTEKYEEAMSDEHPRVFSYAILCGVSWATLHKAFACAMLSQEYFDNIEQDFFLCNVVWNLLGNIAQGFYLCNVGSWLTGNFSE